MGSSVESLQLSYVGLKSWPEWMQYFTSLQKLNIANDPVAPLPDDAFDAFKNSVTDMTFGSVNLTQVSKAFSTLTQIETLFLINTSITELTNLPQSTSLRSLSLSQNNIADSDHLVQSLLPYSKTLNFLDVSINQLSAFPDLSSLSALSIIDFQSNELSDPRTNSLPSSVTMLYLGRNHLTKIPLSVSSMKKLQILLIAYNNITVIKDTEIPAALPELDISYNQIYGLEDDCFPGNSSLTSLDLSSNPIFGISYHAFRNLGRLQDLGLQDTRLTRLPMALSSLTSLQSLSMDYNGRLECTCQEAGLIKWYKSLPNLRITGDCVNMTITHFFEDVAPKCHL